VASRPRFQRKWCHKAFEKLFSFTAEKAKRPEQKLEQYIAGTQWR